ncbi:MAG: cysteine synthase A [Acidobacteriales bacterium]|nr:cysteine synthase A [Terriglobales bacterium]
MNAQQAASALRIAENITDLVGQTPMLHLRRITPAGSADIYAKLEYINPGFSVKDRAAIGMIQRAEAEGRLKEGSTIIEATAGNTGVGLALIGVNKGYRVIFCVPEQFSEEKVKIMQALGAEVLRTPEAEGMQGAIRKAKEIAATIPGSFVALQFENQANPDYHYETTGREIWEQMGGKVDAVVLGVGTGGTFTGVTRLLKSKNPQVMGVAVESQGSILQGGAPGPHKVEGIGVSFIPKTFDPTMADRVLMIHDEEAFQMVKELARKEGVLAGSSGGAVMAAALRIAKELGPGKRVVTVIPDSAERYLSKGIFEGGK